MTAQQSQRAGIAALVAFCVIFAGALWYTDNAAPTYTPAQSSAARTVTGATVKWDTALTNEIGAPARVPYALCTVYRGDRLTITQTYDLDGRLHYLGTRADGCAGWISADAVTAY